MGCDWSVLSHPNLSVPAAALSLPLCLCLCVSVSRCWPPLLLLQAAALCARCRSRVLIDTHTLLSVCAYTTTHTTLHPHHRRRDASPSLALSPLRVVAAAARPPLLTFPLSLPGAADLRVARSSSTAEKERPPATYHHQRQPDSRAAGPRATASSSTQHLHPSPPTSHRRSPANQLAVARPSLRPLHARYLRCWSVSTSPALDRLPRSSLARARLR